MAMHVARSNEGVAGSRVWIPQDTVYVCLNDSHYCHWDVMEEGEKCRCCGESGKIPYYYLSLSEKVWAIIAYAYICQFNDHYYVNMQIKRWCSCKEFCTKMTAHWRDRGHWMHRPGGWMPRKEIWDGKRFAELLWFWDPDEEWLFPVRCPHCRSVISVNETSKRLDRQWQLKTCSNTVITVYWTQDVSWYLSVVSLYISSYCWHSGNLP